MNKERSKAAFNRQILEEAAEWFVEINAGEADIATRRRFDAWLRISPEHVRVYLEMLPIWEDGARLDSRANGDPQALVAWARADSNVVSLSSLNNLGSAARPEQRPRFFQSPLTLRSGRFAASIAVLCVTAAWAAWLLAGRGSTYETAIGEQLSIALADGSRVELNSRSRIRVRFSEEERSIDLLEGQALFQVAKNKTRPFLVRSGGTRVRAVGTQFDVYKKTSGTLVTVLEGRVAVLPEGFASSNNVETADADADIARSSSRRDSRSPSDRVGLAAGSPLLDGRDVEVRNAASNAEGTAFGSSKDQRRGIYLSAGEQAIVTPAAMPLPRRADLVVATAWTQQRLVFSGTPLTEVAEEFNRYNERQLLIKDSELASFNVSGTFSSRDPASLVRFLRVQPGIKVEETSAEILLSIEEEDQGEDFN